MHWLQSVLKCGYFATKLYSLFAHQIYLCCRSWLTQGRRYQKWPLPHITIAAVQLRFNRLQKNFSAVSIKGGFVGKCWSSAQKPVKCTDSDYNEHTGFQGSCRWSAALGQCLERSQVKLQGGKASNSSPVVPLTDSGVILALYLKCMPCLLNTATVLLTQCTFG